MKNSITEDEKTSLLNLASTFMGDVEILLVENCCSILIKHLTHNINESTLKCPAFSLICSQLSWL